MRTIFVGLCDHPLDWPWSSARHHEQRAEGPLRFDLDSLPDDPRETGRP